MTALGDLDHCMILVEDLDGADLALARLGFRPTPRGIHSAHLGTANATVLFQNATYLEPLGVLAPTEANQAQRARLAIGPGPYGTAFRSDDAAAAARAFAAAGIGAGDAVAFVRPVELPAGPAEAAFSVARTRAGAVPGAWLFACEHRTPELVWRDDHLDHPNGALALIEAVGIAADLDALASGWAVMGDRVLRGGNEVVIHSATARLRFLTPEGFAARLGAAALPTLEPPCLAAFVIRVADLERAVDCLALGGVAATRTSDGRLLTHQIRELGCAFELTG